MASPSNMSKQKEFDKLLLESIDDCLKQVFGEPAGKAILAFLEKNQASRGKRSRTELKTSALD